MTTVAKVLLYSILLFIVISCGTLCTLKTSFEMPNMYMDGEFKPYLDEYKKELSDHNIRPLHKVFSFELVDFIQEDEYSAIIGQCTTVDVPVLDWITGKEIEIFHYRKIIVLREYLNKPYKFKWILWHELGHCVFDLDHDETFRNDIMSSTIPFNTFDQEYWNKVLPRYWDKLKKAQEGCENDM